MHEHEKFGKLTCKIYDVYRTINMIKGLQLDAFSL